MALLEMEPATFRALTEYRPSSLLMMSLMTKMAVSGSMNWI
jgi:hypothetical protein